MTIGIYVLNNTVEPRNIDHTNSVRFPPILGPILLRESCERVQINHLVWHSTMRREREKQKRKTSSDLFRGVCLIQPEQIIFFLF